MKVINNFNILKNGLGNLMLIIPATNTNPTNASIFYDGGGYFVLNKGTELFRCEYVHPAIRKDLANKEQILIVEVYDNSIVREYQSKVINTSPKDMENIQNQAK